MRIIAWLSDNILFVLTLFLLAFVPLYPKLPLLDVKNTWVYVRAEDFVVVVVLAVWLILLLCKKITLRTPLTLLILLFWITGVIATIHGVLFIFPVTANVFPNVAFLSFLRRIEYVSVFFIAYAGMRDKRFLPYIVAVLTITLLLVVGYGIGQKYFGFPAFLTMNEEFAKGIPIQLSPLSRVPSTFGGHYDLAAYLVLIIPILISMVFAFRSMLVRVVLLAAAFFGFALLFMTVSRISFFVLLVSLTVILFFQKRKLAILSLPLLALFTLLFLYFSPSLLERFGSTIKEINVLVDAKTGEAIGHPQEVSSTYFKNKVIRQKYIRSKSELDVKTGDLLPASPSAVIPYTILPPKVMLIVATRTPTGEDLPQGTGYINLALSPVIKRLPNFFYEKSQAPTKSEEVLIVHGDFLIKRALAYDLSFTTRFQGEWPRALASFKRNILFGSGYGSVGLAVDNNYLRILGEVGLLGFAAFFALFVSTGIYIRKVLPEVEDPLVKSFVFGFVAGVIGLLFNALFIDVFEASKIAYLFWLLVGVSLGALHFYETKEINLYRSLRNVVTSPYAIIVYLLITAIAVFAPMISNYYVGDDFTWLRWAADCNHGPGCFVRYFTEAGGFFYRPGAKIYFLLMYSAFWLNQTFYHIVSILLHFVVSVLVFLLAKRIFSDFRFSVLTGFLFLILSGNSEVVFWISSTGFLFTAVFSLSSLLLFLSWEESKKTIYFIAALVCLILSMLFHELGIVTPLLLFLYKITTEGVFATKEALKKLHYRLLLFPIVPYLALRFIAQSHWLSGDYSYNLIKLPFNIVGNGIGYFLLALFGPASLGLYQIVRNFSREHIVFAAVASFAVLAILVLTYRKFIRRMEHEDKRTVLFAASFFTVALLPFLGLGNIASRYSYLASLGFTLLFVFSMRKIYNYVRSNGREIALGSVTVVIALFFLLHIVQLQQIHNDWNGAGEKTRRFLLSIDNLYEDYWSKEPMEFHLVNVPIRTGEAWVFPVGLEDALWFIFRNPRVAVYKWQSVEQALALLDGSKNKKVFAFDESGKVTERIKMPNVR